jgi:hypothetical protein
MIRMHNRFAGVVQVVTESLDDQQGLLEGLSFQHFPLIVAVSRI